MVVRGGFRVRLGLSALLIALHFYATVGLSDCRSLHPIATFKSGRQFSDVQPGGMGRRRDRDLQCCTLRLRGGGAELSESSSEDPGKDHGEDLGEDLDEDPGEDYSENQDNAESARFPPNPLPVQPQSKQVAILWSQGRAGVYLVV